MAMNPEFAPTVRPLTKSKTVLTINSAVVSAQMAAHLLEQDKAIDAAEMLQYAITDLVRSMRDLVGVRS